MNKFSCISVIMESVVTFDDIPVEGIIEVPSDQYADYLQDFAGEFWLPSPDSEISQQDLMNLQEVMEPVPPIQFPDYVPPVFPMVPREYPTAPVPIIPPEVVMPDLSFLEMPPPVNGDGDYANPHLEDLPGDLIPGFDGNFLALSPAGEEEEETGETVVIGEEEVTVEETEEEENIDSITPAELAAKIVDHLVIRDELWYFCHFCGQSVYTGRYVISTVLKGRSDLIVFYWEQKAHSKAGLLNKRKLDAIVHERGKLVMKENRF